MTCSKPRTFIIAQIWQWMRHSCKTLADYLPHVLPRAASQTPPVGDDSHVTWDRPGSLVSHFLLCPLTNDTQPSLSLASPLIHIATNTITREEKLTKYTLVKMLIVFYCTSFHGNSCPTTKYVLLHLTTPLRKCNVMTESNSPDRQAALADNIKILIIFLNYDNMAQNQGS